MSIKALMKDDLVNEYRNCPELQYKNRVGYSNELDAVMEIHGKDEYQKIVHFLEGISGKVVELVFTHGDAFEKEDNNYWLPDSLWVMT